MDNGVWSKRRPRFKSVNRPVPTGPFLVHGRSTVVVPGINAIAGMSRPEREASASSKKEGKYCDCLVLSTHGISLFVREFKSGNNKFGQAASSMYVCMVRSHSSARL